MIVGKKNAVKKAVMLVAIAILIGAVFGHENKVQAASQAETVAAYALSQVGIQERTGSNDSKYNDWYPLDRCPWCHIFVSYCAHQCGISTSVIPKTASCQQGVQFFKDKNRYHERTSGYVPKVGDIVYFSTDNTSIAHHVGIVYSVDDIYVHYVDGNNTNMSPHGVARSKKARNNKTILGYGNPDYESVQTPASTSDSAPIPSIHSVSINGIDSANISFSFSVDNATLVKIVIESTLTGETITKSYTSDLSNISYNFSRIDMPTAGNEYYIYLYTYSGSANDYKNEQVHKLTYGSTMQLVTFPTLSNAEVRAITFNSQFYADLYSDLKDTYGYDEDALYRHWLFYGIKEGRIASPTFSSDWYLKCNDDISMAYGSNNYAKAYFHYTTWGYGEERISAPAFHAKYYLDKNTDVSNVYGNNNLLMAATHFNFCGLYELRDSSQYFYGDYYRNHNEDLYNMTSYQLLLHYYKYGLEERRSANTEIPNI